MNLVIIGNGFDAENCGLPTRFSDFRNYLISEYNCNELMPPRFSYNVQQDRHGEESVPLKDVADLFFALMNDALPYQDLETWGEFESGLGKLDFRQFSTDVNRVFDRENDENWGQSNENAQDNKRSLSLAIEEIPILFNDWVESIDVEKRKGTNTSFISKGDLILSFNYTKTLETLGFSNVFHIHGRVGESQLIVGHKPIIKKDLENDEFAFQELQNHANEFLEKNCEEIIKRNKSFFDKIDNVDNVISCGFSYSENDEDYIREIIKRLCKDSKWIIREKMYLDSDRKILARLGFKKEKNIVYLPTI